MVLEKIDTHITLLFVLIKQMFSVEALRGKFHSTDYEHIKKICAEQNIDEIILMKAIMYAKANDFEYVHDLLECVDYENLKNALYKSCIHRCDGFMSIFERIHTSYTNYNKLDENIKRKIDKRDAVGFAISFLRQFRDCPHFIEQSIRVSKKYGSIKCHQFAQKLVRGLPCSDIQNLFEMICKNEPIYSLIYSIHIKQNRRFYDLHKRLMPAIRKYVAFKNGCKLLLTICEKTQNDKTNVPTVDDYVFGNDYLLNRIVRFL